MARAVIVVAACRFRVLDPLAVSLDPKHDPCAVELLGPVLPGPEGLGEEPLPRLVVVLRQIPVGSRHGTEQNDLSQKAFGERIGVSREMVAGVEGGHTGLSMDTLAKLATEFDISLDWLFFGSIARFRDSLGRPLVVGRPQQIVMLPIITQRVSAGAGQAILEDSGVEAALPVLASLVASHPRDKLRVMEVRGDSMTGVHLFDGDFVSFVEGLVRADGIYVIALGGDLMVKRLEWDRANQRITVHSENSRYPEPKHVAMDGFLLRIEGKVVGWFHRHPY
jgi:phage repressor protein C with HTH and peptisase S24 domain